MGIRHWKISTKLSLGFGIVLVLFAAVVLITFGGVNTAGKSVRHLKEESLHYAILAEEMAFSVSQVQQFLTDVGATRDPEAYKEADEAAAEFRKGLAAFKEMFGREKDAKSLATMDEMEKEFAAFYSMGKKMAEAYISEGTDGGNRIMSDFDKSSELLSDKVRTFKAHQVAEANAVAVQATDTLSLVVKILVSLFLGALTIGILISLTITRSICRPLDAVIGIIGRIADGDLTIRLPDESRNETGMLAAAVNRMADSMNGMLTALTKASTNLASASSQLLAQTEQMARGAEEVTAQSEASATASEQMAATSHEIATSCTRAAESSAKANDRASSSFEIIRRTVEGMHRIADKVRHSSENVASLGARSDQIGQIATTIEDIADQTNLLALNAAIEAARAGEQGRGFAVVADEVRALAERTAKATKGITDMIQSIQQETTSAVRAMEDGVAEVSSGTEGAIQSAKALEEIMEEIQTVSQQIGQIAVASEQQSATSGEISNNIHHITGVIEVSSRGTEETAVAARVLSQLAEELQGMVGRFRLAD